MIYMDLQIFSLINNLAAKFPILDRVGVFFAQSGIFLLIAGVFILVLKKGKQALIYLILALALTLLADKILNFVFPTPRPFIIDESVNLLISPPSNPSFPSTHTAAATAFAAIIFYFSKILGVVAVIFAIFVGISRIFVGVHYPSDVLAGIILGLAAFIISVKLTNLLQPSKTLGEKQKGIGKT